MLPTFKDLFSAGGADYARYRPTYPAALFAWLAERSPARGLAVDVGTGNGQVAFALAQHFTRVIGIDPSERQLGHARRHPNVTYSVARAEATGLADASAELLCAAQALHWFSRDVFFAEVQRVVRPGGVFAVWCYTLPEITPAIDEVVRDLYERHLGRYWEPERRLVEDGYRHVAFPFPEMETPTFEMCLDWSCSELAGYLGTWSPLKRYIEDHGRNPLDDVRSPLEQAWGLVPTRTVRWPLVVRAFRVGA